jgi:hypothetical protein
MPGISFIEAVPAVVSCAVPISAGPVQELKLVLQMLIVPGETPVEPATTVAVRVSAEPCDSVLADRVRVVTVDVCALQATAHTATRKRNAPPEINIFLCAHVSHEASRVSNLAFPFKAGRLRW